MEEKKSLKEKQFPFHFLEMASLRKEKGELGGREIEKSDHRLSGQLPQFATARRPFRKEDI